MYVDKVLTGVAAVQTLSRLNRIHPMKSEEDVHVLDFVNQAADIQEAFKPWFETTISEPTDPNLLYDRQRKVMEFGLLAASEMEAFIRVLGGAGPGTDARCGRASAARRTARVPEAGARPLRCPGHR